MRRCAVVTALLLGAVIAASCGSAAPVVLQAKRMIQFDSVVFGRAAGSGDGQKHGSGKSAIRGAVVGLDESPSLSPATPLMIDADALVGVDHRELLASAVGGLIVALPEALTPEVSAALRGLEEAGVKHGCPGAVYVVPHSANLTELAALRAASDSVHALATADAPTVRTAAANTKSVVLAADVTRSSSAAGGRGGKERLVVLAAALDTLGAFPAMPQPGSGADAAVALEVAHMFEGAATVGAEGRGLLVVLSSGNRHSYHGLKSWAASPEAAPVIDRIDAVISLEGVAADGGAKQPPALHLAREPTAGALKEVAAAFGTATPTVRKIDPSSSELRWGHEVFAHKGIAAATLGGAKATRQALRTSMVGASPSLDDIRAAAERVAQGVTALTGIAATSAASTSRIEKHLKAIQADAAPRPTYAMPAAVVAGAWRSLAGVVTPQPAADGKAATNAQTKKRLRKLEFPFQPPEAVLYAPDAAFITFYAAKPMAFELTLTAVIVAVLVSTAVGLLGVSGTKRLIKSPFKAK